MPQVNLREVRRLKAAGPDKVETLTDYVLDRLHDITDTCSLKSNTYADLGLAADGREIMFKIAKKGNWISKNIHDYYPTVDAIEQKFVKVRGKDRAYGFLANRNVKISTADSTQDTSMFHGERLTKKTLIKLCNTLIEQVG